jgi:hypothetical protein
LDKDGEEIGPRTKLHDLPVTPVRPHTEGMYKMTAVHHPKDPDGKRFAKMWPGRKPPVRYVVQGSDDEEEASGSGQNQEDKASGSKLHDRSDDPPSVGLGTTPCDNS